MLLLLQGGIQVSYYCTASTFICVVCDIEMALLVI